MGVAEGFNGKANLPNGKAFGFKKPQSIESALFHVFSQLPEAMFALRFYIYLPGPLKQCALLTKMPRGWKAAPGARGGRLKAFNCPPD